MTPATTILNEAAECFSKARFNLFHGARRLKEISDKRLWDGQYGSFGEFVETECQISQGFASKLIAVFTHYSVESGLSHAKLADIDQEKLYLAMRLPLKAEEQLVRAQSWSRSELKAELASKGGAECQHPSSVEICTVCHSRV